MKQAQQAQPQIAEIFSTYIAIIREREGPLAPEDLLFLERGTQAFPRDVTIASAVARHHLSQGRRAIAQGIVARAVAMGAIGATKSTNESREKLRNSLLVPVSVENTLSD